MPENKGLEAIKQAYLGDAAYDSIANAIISGVFRPGQKLTVRKLADLLEISSTPVRDAIKRLLLEGALEQRAPRDIRVPIITAERYREIADIRLELEGLAAARSAERRCDADLRLLEGNIAENEAALAAGDTQKAIGLNKRFHFALAKISRMPTLGTILGGLWLRIGPPISSFYAFGGRRMIDQHYHILDAIRDHRPDDARRHIATDISQSVDNIVAHMKASSQTSG